MSTYADMKARIAREIMRSDLTTQIAEQIQSAIAEYQRKVFFFNEKTNASWNTVANQELYATTDGVPSDIVSIDKLTVIYANTRYDVIRREWDWIEDRQTSTLKGGAPTDWAYREQKIRLLPIPTTVMPLNLAYIQRVTAPSADGDVGPWVNDAEELIRSAAKKRLFAHNIVDEAEAALMQQAEALAFDALKGETTMRLSTGRVRPTQF